MVGRQLEESLKQDINTFSWDHLSREEKHKFFGPSQLAAKSGACFGWNT